MLSCKKVHYRAHPECLSHIPEQFLQHGFEQRLQKTDDEVLRSQASIPGLSLEFQLDMEPREGGSTEAAQVKDKTDCDLQFNQPVSGTQLSPRCSQCQINPVIAANAISCKSDHTPDCTVSPVHFSTISAVYSPPTELLYVSAHVSDVRYPLTFMSDHSYQHDGSYDTSFPFSHTGNFGADLPATSPDHSFPSYPVFIPDHIEQSPGSDVTRNSTDYHRSVGALPTFTSDGGPTTQYVTEEEFTMPNQYVSFNYPAY